MVSPSENKLHILNRFMIHIIKTGRRQIHLGISGKPSWLVILYNEPSSHSQFSHCQMICRLNVNDVLQADWVRIESSRRGPSAIRHRGLIMNPGGESMVASCQRYGPLIRRERENKIGLKIVWRRDKKHTQVIRFYPRLPTECLDLRAM